MPSSTTRGFHLVAVLLVAAVVMVAGLVGWRVWEAAQTPTAPAPAQAVANAVPVVNSTADLDSLDSFIGNLDTSAEQEELTTLGKEVSSF